MWISNLPCSEDGIFEETVLVETAGVDNDGNPLETIRRIRRSVLDGTIETVHHRIERAVR